MNNKLLVRPKPFPDESFLGYIIRLCEVNGYISPLDVLEAIGDSNYRFKTYLSDELQPDLESFALLVQKGYSEPKVQPKPFIDSNYRKFLNSLVKPKMIQSTRPKFCPLCLQSTAYYRAVWDLPVVTACPIHKCLLITNCPNCTQEFKLRRKYVCKCECGFDLREIEFIEELPEDELIVAGHIYLQLGLSISGSNFIPTHNPLINYCFADFTLVVKYFAEIIISIDTGEHYQDIRFKKKVSNETCHLALSKVLPIFDNFPTNYINFIDEYLLCITFSESKYGQISFARYHPSFYGVMHRAKRTFIYKAFTENINSLLDKHSIPGRRRQYKPDEEYILVSEAEKNFRATKSEFKYILSSNQLKVKFLSYERGTTLFVESDSYLKLKIERESWVNEADIAIQLDVSGELVKQLADDGNLLIRMKGIVKGTNHYFFDGDLSIKLLSKLRSNISPPDVLSEKELIDFGQIEKLLNFDIKQLSNFLRLCFKGRIKPAQELLDEKGIRRFLFTKKDVEFVISNFCI